jgi:hypothetical protein
MDWMQGDGLNFKHLLNKKFLLLFICILSIFLVQAAFASTLANPPKSEGTSTILSVLTGESNQVLPKIFQNEVIWVYFDDNGNSIHTYDFSTGYEQVIESEFSPVDSCCLAGII